MTGAADSKKPGAGVSTTTGPLPDDDASSPGVEDYRDRVREGERRHGEADNPSGRAS